MLHGKEQDRARWIAHLETIIEGVVSEVPFETESATRTTYIDGFRDEFGNRRASDRPFLAHLLGVAMEPLREPGAMSLDERLWWTAARRSQLPDDLLALSGGLHTDPNELAIEYRTMVELGALHALWWLAIRDDDGSLTERAMDAARWHVDEIQPDNAINRPWGLAVFVELSTRSDDESVSMTADLHAQTLLHNACINFGKPDLLSALILQDAAAQLRECSAG